MEAVARMPDRPDTQRMIIVPAFGKLVDLYWLALASLQNVLEDIAGTDGRLEYLISLRCRLIEVCQEMDDLLSGSSGNITVQHRLAVALERGMPHFGVSARDVAERLYFVSPDVQHDELQATLLAFGEAFAGRLPGQIPAAQGPLGQGQTLRAMRNWSTAAAKTGEDLGFLSERFLRL